MLKVERKTSTTCCQSLIKKVCSQTINYCGCLPSKMAIIRHVTPPQPIKVDVRQKNERKRKKRKENHKCIVIDKTSNLGKDHYL